MLKGLKETLIASASDVLCRLCKDCVGLEGHIDVLYLLTVGPSLYFSDSVCLNGYAC